MSLDEYEAARMLLTTLNKDEPTAPPSDRHKTAPYLTFTPEMAKELGRRKDVPTPYQPPLSTSQHMLSTPPSNIPSRGPSAGRYTPSNQPSCVLKS